MSEQRKMVGVAHAAVAGEGEELVALGLGSCVAIVLHDPVARVGGMAHVLLPHPPREGEPANPAKFASTAVAELIRRMGAAGADPGRLVARLVGGASMFGAALAHGGLHTGQRNIAAAREALHQAGIPLHAEEVGREHGRSVYFDPARGTVRVTSVMHGERTL